MFTFFSLTLSLGYIIHHNLCSNPDTHIYKHTYSKFPFSVCVVCFVLFVCAYITKFGGSSGGLLIAYMSLWTLCILSLDDLDEWQNHTVVGG